MPFLELEGETEMADNPRQLGAELTVGSGSQASWRLPGRDLAARHFRLVCNTAGGARVYPASTQNVVVLNGAQVPAAGEELHSADVIAAGSARFIYLDAADAKRPAPPGDTVPAFLVNSGTRRGYQLRKRVVQIGREIGCSIVLRDPTVSRFHADIRSEGGEYVIYSMGSGGTRVNDATVSRPRMLVEGDRIAIGESVFTFVRGALPSGVTPAQFEDHADDSFSRKRTQLATPTITAEFGKYGSRRRRARRGALPWIVGLGVVAVAVLAYLAFLR